MGYYLAIEVGETAGHHLLGYLEKDKLQLEEIYHFEKKGLNNEIEKGWDLQELFNEIKHGIRKCNEIGRLPIFIGIDTWGVEILLLDEEQHVIGRTEVDGQKETTISKLSTILENNPEYTEKVKAMLLFPDYLNYLLTGVKLCEYTTVATTGLIDLVSQGWKDEIIDKLGFSKDIYQEIKRPGAVLGNLTRAVTEEVGYDCIIVLPATHAASSAYFALPSKEEIDQINSPETTTLLRSAENETGFSASAIGNLLVQMIISHELKDVQAAQECVRNSFVKC